MSSLTQEQIIALAPDPSSAKAGKELASARKWVSLGFNDRAAWGECQGSAKTPYQTQIDLSEPAFKCSCPSRKFPCKHGLGLFLLLAAQPGAFTSKIQPAWVTEWLDKRSQAAQKPAKVKKENEPDPAAQARRAARREDRVKGGLGDLDLWLSDLVRQGLSSVQSKPQAYWEMPAARLVDAQAPGLARRVREMAAIPGSGDGWQERLLSQASLLHLLTESYGRMEHLPFSIQEEIRMQIGWTQDQDALLKQEGVPDTWFILGRRVEAETLGKLGRSASLKVQRTWLWGDSSRRPALLLNFAAPGQTLDVRLVPGTKLEAELVFFLGAFPLRALVKKQSPSPKIFSPIPGSPSILDATQAYTTALTANPWLDLFPMALNQVIPLQMGDHWGLRDPDGYFLPFSQGFSQAWTLLAISGNHPIDIFGEWDGESIWPLSACAEGRFILLQPIIKEEA
jgi:hypothetical protein